jgi:hypothetical protein
MSIISKTTESFNHEINRLATSNINRKLKKQGIDPNELNSVEFNALVADEVKILESDSKKVGLGIGIGLAISLLTGF